MAYNNANNPNAQYQKELEVPTFNKKEIQAIAIEGVKSAIEKGAIENVEVIKEINLDDYLSQQQRLGLIHTLRAALQGEVGIDYANIEVFNTKPPIDLEKDNVLKVTFSVILDPEYDTEGAKTTLVLRKTTTEVLGTKLTGFTSELAYIQSVYVGAKLSVGISNNHDNYEFTVIARKLNFPQD